MRSSNRIGRWVPGNLGVSVRALRVVAGAGILALAFVGPATLWGYLGLMPLLTGLIGFCPATCPLGLSSCTVRTSKR